MRDLQHDIDVLAWPSDSPGLPARPDQKIDCDLLLLERTAGGGSERRAQHAVPATARSDEADAGWQLKRAIRAITPPIVMDAVSRHAPGLIHAVPLSIPGA